MIKKYFLLVLLFSNLVEKLYSQDDTGYWDKERATYKEIVLGAGNKTWYRTDELPIGTTEVIYRITLLDENQKLTNSLVSILGNIPTAYTQASAGIIELTSQIAGDDKCLFSIFSSYVDAQNYLKNNNSVISCYSHPIPINREAGRLTLNNSTCLGNTNYLWFGFKSTNDFLDEKIIIEVVPWVNKKASRGWSNEIKQKFMTTCKTMKEFNIVSNPDTYCQCLLEKLQKDYTVQDFQQLIESEKNKIVITYANNCLSDTGELDIIANRRRNDAISLINNRRFGDAINVYLEVINNYSPTSIDYNNIGYCYILTKQYLKAIKYLTIGEKLDETELNIKGNLAHAYLLSGEIEQSKQIYLKYKSQNVSNNMSWSDMVKSDFADFEKAGITSENFKIILDIIN